MSNSCYASIQVGWKILMPINIFITALRTQKLSGYLDIWISCYKSVLLNTYFTGRILDVNEIRHF